MILAVENLPDFPGATFDRATGLFEWTPPLNFVTNEMSRQVTLTVFMQTMKGPRLSLRKSFNVFVTRVESDPEIVAVEAIPLSREGEIKNFHVTVKDPDSSSAANGSTKIVYNQCTSGFRYRLASVDRWSARTSGWNQRHLGFHVEARSERPRGESKRRTSKLRTISCFALRSQLEPSVSRGASPRFTFAAA